MSKTTTRHGWNGGRGEIPSLRRPENTARGNPERITVGELDGDPAYEADHPWTDAEFVANAKACTGLLELAERLREPVAMWSDADVELVAAILKRGDW